MKKIFLVIIFMCMSGWLFVDEGNGKEGGLSQKATALIERYVHDKPDPMIMDSISPYYGQIVQMGVEAVEPLLAALKNDDPSYVEERLAFIYILGQIGDQRAYVALRDEFFHGDGTEGFKWRGMISLGSCLTEDRIDDYIVLALEDTTGGGVRALREMSEQDFGADAQQWAAYLKIPGSLELFKKNCRQRSAPILG